MFIDVFAFDVYAGLYLHMCIFTAEVFVYAHVLFNNIVDSQLIFVTGDRTESEKKREAQNHDISK